MLDSIEKFANILVGILGSWLAVYTLYYNKDAVFRNTLHNKQLE